MPVPAAAVRTTGIAGLDAQFGGGVPPGTTILLLGDPSNCIGLFSEQFAAGGVHEADDVLFFELDRPVAHLRERILGLATNGTTANGRLRLFDGYAPQFGANANGRLGDADAEPLDRKAAFEGVLSHLLGAEPANRRVVLESLSALVTPENQSEVIEFFRRLVFLGQEFGSVQLVSIVRGLHDAVLETQLKHLASGVIEVGVERKGFGIYSTLQVSKMANVQDPLRLLLFRETDKGLWLESTKRVF